MSKKKLIIGISFLTLLIFSFGVYVKVIAPMIKGNRVEARDTLLILSAIVTSTLENVEKLPGYQRLTDIQVRKFKDKMGGCLFLSLMRMPEIKGDFDYMTLKQKAETVEKAVKTTYNAQYAKDLEQCYYQLDEDLKKSFPVNWR